MSNSLIYILEWKMAMQFAQLCDKECARQYSSIFFFSNNYFWRKKIKTKQKQKNKKGMNEWMRKEYEQGSGSFTS